MKSGENSPVEVGSCLFPLFAIFNLHPTGGCFGISEPSTGINTKIEAVLRSSHIHGGTWKPNNPQGLVEGAMKTQWRLAKGPIPVGSVMCCEKIDHLGFQLVGSQIYHMYSKPYTYMYI